MTPKPYDPLANHLARGRTTGSAASLPVPMNRKPYDPPADHWRVAASPGAILGRAGNSRSHFEVRARKVKAAPTCSTSRERTASLTDDQLAAWKWPAKCYRQLGAERLGRGLMTWLVRGMTDEADRESRGQAGANWERYFARRLWECLNTLAAVYGLPNEEKRIRALAPKPRSLARSNKTRMDAQVIQQLSPHQQGHAHACREIHPADGNAEEPCLTRRSPAGSEHLPACPGQIAGRQQQVVWGPRARGGTNPYCT